MNRTSPLIVLSLLALALGAAGVRAETAPDDAVKVERPAGHVCYRYQAQSVCLRDEDQPPGISFTLDKGAKPEKWDYVAKSKLGAAALTREALGANRFETVDGFTKAMNAIMSQALQGEQVKVERPAGKICYRYQSQALCLNDLDQPAGISFTFNKGARPEKWEYLSKAQLGLTLTRETLGSSRLDEVGGFLEAVKVLQSKTLFKAGDALDGLRREAKDA